MQKNNYGNDSIDLLLGAERIRKRPASMLGDNGLDGARHGFTEIYGNALDEASSGFGDRLDVTYYKDGSISLRDYGRGVPLGWNKLKKSYNWHIIYNELYGGGKYDNGQWYLRSIGHWSIWSEDSMDLLVPIKRNYGIDLNADLPSDGNVYDFGVFSAKRLDGKIYLKINNVTWDTATWEFLNSTLNYLASVGLNGLGAASTQYTSEFFTVKSYRDGVCTEVNFKNGYPVFDGKVINMFDGSANIEDYPPLETSTNEANGTFIHWKPDNTVFTNTDIGANWLYETCKDISSVANITLNFKDESTGKEINLEAGTLRDLSESKLGNSAILDDDDKPIIFECNKYGHGNIKVEGRDFVWVCKVDINIGLTNSNVDCSCYHNSVKMKSGTQYGGIFSALDRFFSDVSKSSGVKIQSSDYEGCFGVFVSSYSNYASFRNQTKDEVQDDFIFELVMNTVYDKLVTEYSKGNRHLADIVASVIDRANDRISAKYLAKVSKEVKKMANQKAPSKFVSCKAYDKKNYEIAELWITEGDGASGSVKGARSKDFQAVFPIRGKGLNVLKSSIDNILENQEIKNLFALLGTGFDLNLKNMENTFDISKLKFNKIIFATDADEDGYQIRVLLFLVFYKLAPELLRKGHIYVAETPRFEIVLSDGTCLYALDDKGRDKYINEYGSRIRNINRFKGLGEVNPDVLSKTTVAPESRNLIRLSCDFENEFEREVIDALFGLDKYKQRKQILTNALGGDVANMLEENNVLFEKLDNTDFEEDIEYEVV